MELTLTATAANKVKEILIHKEMPDGLFRVFVSGGGCSGYQYAMALSKEAEDDDIVLSIKDVRIVIDPDSIKHIDGVEIDYVEDIMKSGFSIFNPNATKSCSCGSSFQTADGSGKARSCGS